MDRVNPIEEDGETMEILTRKSLSCEESAPRL
jgi:hypothetical protein